MYLYTLADLNIVPAIIPVDASTGANNGAWVDMTNYYACKVVVFKGIGTAAQDPVITLKQAQDSSGTGAKALTFATVRQKVGATALSAIGTYSGFYWNGSAFVANPTGTVTPSSTSLPSTYTPASSAANEALVEVDIDARSLDLVSTPKFTHIQLSIPDVGANAQIIAGFYILFGSRYRGSNVQPANA